jgi:hypothetical protein
MPSQVYYELLVHMDDFFRLYSFSLPKITSDIFIKLRLEKIQDLDGTIYTFSDWNKS